jgi:hypothetical protein
MSRNTILIYHRHRLSHTTRFIVGRGALETKRGEKKLVTVPKLSRLGLTVSNGCFRPGPLSYRFVPHRKHFNTHYGGQMHDHNHLNVKAGGTYYQCAWVLRKDVWPWNYYRVASQLPQAYTLPAGLYIKHSSYTTPFQPCVPHGDAMSLHTPTEVQDGGTKSIYVARIWVLTTVAREAGIRDWLRAGRPRGRSSRVPIGGQEFSLHVVQIGSAVHPTSSPMGTGAPFPGGKAAGAWS